MTTHILVMCEAHECPETFVSIKSYSKVDARKHAAALGWARRRDAAGKNHDYCPQHKETNL